MPRLAQLRWPGTTIGTTIRCEQQVSSAQVRAASCQQSDAFDVMRHREHTNDVTRDCGSLRPAAVNGRKWPLTCNDADFRRCWRQGPVAGLCESKRAQTAPCCQQAPTIANARKDRSVRDSWPARRGQHT